ncbi:hypothetical protein J6590_009928 [Homalodisca vitripennis]|nr:hypothetical protein J6590_009928 [Homalodisca vitripennis]
MSQSNLYRIERYNGGRRRTAHRLAAPPCGNIGSPGYILQGVLLVITFWTVIADMHIHVATRGEVSVASLLTPVLLGPHGRAAVRSGVTTAHTPLTRPAQPTPQIPIVSVTIRNLRCDIETILAKRICLYSTEIVDTAY